MYCCKRLNLKEHQVRYRASYLGLRVSIDATHLIEARRKTAKKITGRKRPEQSEVMKKLWNDGRLTAKKPTKTNICINCGVEYLARKRYHGVSTCCSDKCVSERRATVWQRNKHPRGMLNKHHTAKTRKILSKKFRLAWKNPTSKFNSEEFRQRRSDANMRRHADKTFYNDITNPYSRCKATWWKSGKRKYYMRSGWEYNYAWYLEWLRKRGEIKKWEYEAETFWFEAIRRGVRSYTPDFKIFKNDGSIEYHEVKGWMDSKSKTKLKRMEKYYPDVILHVIGEAEYKSIREWSTLIPGWE